MPLTFMVIRVLPSSVRNVSFAIVIIPGKSEFDPRFGLLTKAYQRANILDLRTTVVKAEPFSGNLYPRIAELELCLSPRLIEHALLSHFFPSPAEFGANLQKTFHKPRVSHCVFFFSCFFLPVVKVA